MSKELIINYRYTSSIHANGTVFIIFDYYTYDFKVNETHYFNFYFLEIDWFLSEFIKWKNLFISFYKSSNYLSNFRSNNSIINNTIKVSFFDNKVISLKKKVVLEESIFKKKICVLRNSILIYNNYYIIHYLKFFFKKSIFTIFFNF